MASVRQEKNAQGGHSFQVIGKCLRAVRRQGEAGKTIVL